MLIRRRGDVCNLVMGYFDYYDVCQKFQNDCKDGSFATFYFFRELEYSASEGYLIIVTYDHLIANLEHFAIQLTDYMSLVQLL